MFLEYDWTFNVYRPRFGQTFIDFRGARSWPSLEEAKAAIEAAGCQLGRKTDSRTWEIVSLNENVGSPFATPRTTLKDILD